MIKLENYRDRWIAEGIDDYIGFYTREFFVFDNFSSFMVLFRGVLYSTSEHAYQALKFIKTAPEIYQEICDCYSAHDAQKIARREATKADPEWDNIKVALMEEIIRAKMEQNPIIKQKLLQTEDYTICEDSPKDAFWGIGFDRKGRNELGKLWMKLRDELRGKQP